MTDEQFLQRVTGQPDWPHGVDSAKWLGFARKLLDVPPSHSLPDFLHTRSVTNFPSQGISPRFVRNAFSTATEEADIKRIYAALHDHLSPWAKGVLSFFLFTRAADLCFTRGAKRQAAELSAAERSIIDGHLNQASESGVVSAIYAIAKPLAAGRLSFLTVGSRHYVIRLPGSDHCLALLKPYLFDVLGLSDGELKRYDEPPCMQATSLRDYANEHLRDKTAIGASDLGRGIGPSQCEQARRVANYLCDALKASAADGRPHLNLVPEHIHVVASSAAGVTNVLVTGHGYNKLSDGRLGTWKAHQASKLFLAPEVMEDPDSGSFKSDAYSVGIVLLELFSGRALTVENIDECMLALWRTHPELAAFVDNLTQPLAEDRLVSVQNDHTVFDEINRQLLRHIAMEADSAAPAAGAVNIGLLDFWGPFRSILDTREKAAGLRREGMRAARQGMAVDPLLTARARLLARRTYTTALAYLLHAYTTYYFITHTFWDERSSWSALKECCWHLDVATDWVQFQKFWQAEGSHGLLWGRLVAWTFSYVCFKYFWFILSGVSAATLPGSVRKSVTVAQVDWFVRVACCVVWWVCILITMIYDPHTWPWTSGIGMITVTLLNFWLYRIMAGGVEQLNERHRVPPRVLEGFGVWGPTSIMYVIFLFATWLFLRQHILTDEWMYTLIVSIYFNVYVMGRQALKTDGPGIRATFERIVAAKTASG